MELLAAAGVRQHLAERPARIGRRAFGDERAVEVHAALSSGQRGKISSALTTTARHGAAEVLGLLRPEAGAHLGELHVARGKIVEHDKAADGRFGVASVGIAQRMRQHEAELQLVVERARVATA